jgi:hypothetical protein
MRREYSSAASVMRREYSSVIRRASASSTDPQHLRVEVVASSSASLVARVPHGAHRRVDDPALEQHDDPDEQQRRPDIGEHARDVDGAARVRDDRTASRDCGEAEHDAPRDPRPPDARAGGSIHPFSVRLAPPAQQDQQLPERRRGSR